MLKMTISMMDSHIGRINWSVWSEKDFDVKVRLKWKPSQEDRMTWKRKVTYQYRHLSEQIKTYPEWLLQSFDAILSELWRKWFKQYITSKQMNKPLHKKNLLIKLNRNPGKAI